MIQTMLSTSSLKANMPTGLANGSSSGPFYIPLAAAAEARGHPSFIAGKNSGGRFGIAPGFISRFE